MDLKTVLIAMALLLIGSTASAFVTNLPETITVGESAYELTFFVQNTTSIRQPLSARFTIPTKYTIIKKADWIEANSRSAIVLKIFPQKGFENSTYTGQINLELGGNRAEKSIIINYINENKCPVNIDIEVADNNSTITIENESYRAKTLELADINGGAGLKFTGENKFALGAFEKKTFAFPLISDNQLDGEVKFTFSCNGQEVFRTENIRSDGSGIFAAFAIIAKDSEFILNAGLVIIASILLIAFIARMIRTLNSGGVK
ncbi:MAG TPA: hypothetical protein VJG83_04335 [archaeon]|nr:hypothetical protein [archaeon]